MRRVVADAQREERAVACGLLDDRLDPREAAPLVSVVHDGRATDRDERIEPRRRYPGSLEPDAVGHSDAGREAP